MKTPTSIDEAYTVFGDIRAYIHSGLLDNMWEQHVLAVCDLPGEIPLGWDPTIKVSRFRCHYKLVPRLRAVFDGIKANGIWDELKTFDGCYNYRTQRGDTGKLSLHAFGAAVDLNAGTNKLGEEPHQHPGLIQCFEAVGFYWGGRFARPDGMHFQFARGF